MTQANDLPGTRVLLVSHGETIGVPDGTLGTLTEEESQGSGVPIVGVTWDGDAGPTEPEARALSRYPAFAWEGDESDGPFGPGEVPVLSVIRAYRDGDMDLRDGDRVEFVASLSEGDFLPDSLRGTPGPYRGTATVRRLETSGDRHDEYAGAWIAWDGTAEATDYYPARDTVLVLGAEG